MTKRKMSENSLKNLKKDFTPAERSENGRKGAAKTNQIKKENIKRETAKEWLWNEFGVELSNEIIKSGTTKDKLELLKAILPPDKLTNEVTGSIGIEKIFITQEEKEATDKHIDDVINDGFEE